MTSILSEKLSTLPNTPGVYIFKNDEGKIIYVGKAKNLKNRVGSYFHIKVQAETKTSALVSRINDITWVEVESEFDALILEAELIKKYRPKYNIVQKDDKTYLYIVIRPEFVTVDSRKINILKVITARQTDLLPKDVKFGPYPDGSTAKFVVRTLRKLFPFRDCSIGKFNTYHKRGKPCLYGQIGICPGPCVNYSETDLAAYNKIISQIKKILKGGSFNVLTALKKEMKKYALAHDYEKAAYYRDLAGKFEYVRQRYKMPQSYIENPTLTDDLADQALNALMDLVPILTKKPYRIECYDISNISGKEAVGSLVVATDGKIDKREYKRFRVKLKDTPDDFSMLKEVIARRLSHHSKSEKPSNLWPDPDLLIIDGGKGQVSAVCEVIEWYQKFFTNGTSLNLDVIGLAKKFETIVYKTGNDFVEIKADKNNQGLTLLIRLRDEAHRFAQNYHHKLRSKLLLKKV